MISSSIFFLCRINFILIAAPNLIVCSNILLVAKLKKQFGIHELYWDFSCKS